MAIIIAVEGNIGSGKSTLVDFLKRTYSNSNIMGRDVIFIQEPVNEWASITDIDGEGILEKFYKDQEQWSFSFQMMAYISRLALLKDAVKSNPNSIIFTERSLFTDKNVFAQMLFDDNKISKIDFSIYNKWFHHFIDEVSISGIVYLQSDPVICNERVIKRNRPGEQIPLEYLTKCHDYHEKWIMSDKNETPNKIVIDCNIDHNDQPDILIQWFNKINSFVAYIISSNNYSAKMDHMLGSKVEGTIDRMLSKD